MNFVDIQSAVRMISYKPGSRIRAFPGIGPYDEYIGISIAVPSLERDSHQPSFLYANCSISLFAATEQELLKVIREAIRTMELHEVDEWIKFKGERIFDPHAAKFTLEPLKKMRSL